MESGLEAKGKIENLCLRFGDVFCTGHPMWFGRVIQTIQAFWSKDGKAIYSHSGIILDEAGITFEALMTYRCQNLFEAYAGVPTIIARPKEPDVGWQQDPAAAAYELFEKYNRKWYPGWRLLLHVFPPLAKISLIDMPVCSELTALYEKAIGVREYPAFGTNPDTLADEWKKWKSFDVIFEGVLCGENSIKKA